MTLKLVSWTLPSKSSIRARKKLMDKGMKSRRQAKTWCIVKPQVREMLLSLPHEHAIALPETLAMLTVLKRWSGNGIPVEKLLLNAFIA